MNKLTAPSEELVKANEKNYNESAFWKKIRKVAGRVGANAVFYALSLYYIMTSAQVSLKDKAYIAGALGYLIVPLDLVPDVIPVLGFTDDISALVMVYKQMKYHLTPDLREKALQKIREWFGSDAAEHLQQL
ncbi:MAG: DUF1232 domain-containing protein [Bacteroidales bacterium]|nr:DUF1232 domain-containing protein [Candidatus Colicola faecequi]